MSGEDSLRGVKRFLWILLIAAVILGIWGVVSRVRGREKIGQETSQEAIPVVRTAKPTASPASDELVLPGNVTAFIEAPIYARTSGYLKSWYTDIGTPVKRGQLLAEIETPEVDQQLRQSKSDLATAEANARIATSTDARWKGLLVNKAVSPQDAETRAASAEAAQAAAASAQANVGRLEELESFKRVVAPFDGVVTARNTDIGALINAGNGGAAQQLFTLAATNTLRVFVSVPQAYSRSAAPGVAAQLTLAEYPNRRFMGKIARNAESIDPTSRTLNTEVDVDNSTGELLPGAFAQVHLTLLAKAPSLLLPVNSLLFRAEGLQAGVVREGGKVQLVPIVIGRDYGTEVEVVSAGLTETDNVIVNPSDSLATGTIVRLANTKP
jgi:RND family efflux transporter MFP subunit